MVDSNHWEGSFRGMTASESSSFFIYLSRPVATELAQGSLGRLFLLQHQVTSHVASFVSKVQLLTFRWQLQRFWKWGARLQSWNQFCLVLHLVASPTLNFVTGGSSSSWLFIWNRETTNNNNNWVRVWQLLLKKLRMGKQDDQTNLIIESIH